VNLIGQKEVNWRDGIVVSFHEETGGGWSERQRVYANDLNPVGMIKSITITRIEFDVCVEEQGRNEACRAG